MTIENGQGNTYTNVFLIDVMLLDALAAELIVGGDVPNGAIMRCVWRVRQL